MATATSAPGQHAPDPHAGWSYVDEARSHSVRLFLEASARGGVVHVVESAFGDEDPTSRLHARHVIVDPWELQFHRAELESRLATLGNYWVSEGALWRPLARRAAVDVAPLSLCVGSTQAALHYFHHASGGGRLLLALPAVGSSAGAPRFSLAQIEVESLVAVEARSLHASLPGAPLRSILTQEHRRAAEDGFVKLRSASEFGLIHGPAWRERLLGVIEQGAAKLRAPARVAEPETKPAEAERLAVVTRALVNDPRLARIHARFLAAGEEEGLLRGGEPVILRAIAAKRKGVPIGDQHLLSILEASLLLRERLRDRSKIDPEIVERVDRLEYYLRPAPRADGKEA